VLLFGLPDRKDDIGSAAYDPEARSDAVRAIKRGSRRPVATDVCLCEYTDHGHCGIVVDEEIVNDASVSSWCARRLTAVMAPTSSRPRTRWMAGSGRFARR
jgi:porphobilinogen synthase